MAEKLYFETNEANNLGTLDVDEDPTIAKPNHVKKNYAYKNTSSREVQIGIMPINPSENIKINPKTEGKDDTSFYAIPEGYHDGTGKIYTGELSEYTPGNATPEDIVFNKVSFVNGKRIVGSLNVEQVEQVATATPKDIVEGETAWVNKEKITGTIPKLPRKDKTLLGGESYIVPYGLSPGTITISATSLKSQTIGDITPEDVTSGKTGWSNGEKVVGNFVFEDELKKALIDTDAKREQVLEGKKFYSTEYGTIAMGTMIDHSNEPIRTIEIGTPYYIPIGYYDGFSQITTKTLKDVTIASAKANHILDGKTAYAYGEEIVGTMPNNVPKDIKVNAGESYNIPEGYHDGNGTVTGQALTNQTPGTANAEDILDGKTSWRNGELVTGTMPNNTPTDIEISPGEVKYIDKGYHTGAGSIHAKTLKECTPGTASSEDIPEGKNAWVEGVNIQGSAPNNEAVAITLNAGEHYDVPVGFYKNSSRISAAVLENQTPGTAEADDILDKKTSWVNGNLITGTLKLTGDSKPSDVLDGKTFYNTDAKTIQTGTLKLTGNATEEMVVEGTTFYNTNPKHKRVGTMRFEGTAKPENVLINTTFYNTDPKTKVQGSMPNNGTIIKIIDAGVKYDIPEGYHDGKGSITAKSLETQTPGTAMAEDIIKGKTSWKDGNLITGTLEFSGTANAEDVLETATFYNRNPKQKITGAIKRHPTTTVNIKNGEEYNIPKGYYDGTSKIVVDTLASQTQATAIPEDILDGKTAYVNGKLITGNIPTYETKTVRITAGNDITLPAGYYPNGITIYSLVPELLDLTGTDAFVKQTNLHPESAGYVDEPKKALVTEGDSIK